MEIVVPKQYLSKWDKLRDKIECIIVRIKLIKWHVKDYEFIETPKNEVLEYYKQTLEKLDKTLKDLTEWICGGNKNE